MKNIKPQKILLAFVIMLCMNAEETGAQSMPRLYSIIKNQLQQNVKGK